tara:strand:- start:5192 stop:5416 length:225 start_codon:yes stop_codon:yes gene_type:complete
MLLPSMTLAMLAMLALLVSACKPILTFLDSTICVPKKSYRLESQLGAGLSASSLIYVSFYGNKAKGTSRTGDRR